ncbi:putative uncharacterized protein DDB_G0282133 [Oppia nitens]|uniref:putative uncharacterized protein DDB_G0282133 n=1 Tax=Oppia nitens TaxID=1686743 RepID=UPI0023DB5324|nr:putative uncharacterized protein DDB_G0282133 [Oppia nitens]
MRYLRKLSQKCDYNCCVKCLLLFLALIANTVTTSDGQIVSKIKLCADQDCKEPISMGRTTLKYPKGSKNMLSFGPNQLVTIYGITVDKKHLDVEIDSKRGFVPSFMIKVEKDLIKDPKIEVIVNLNLNDSKDNVIDNTSVDQKLSDVNSNSDSSNDNQSDSVLAAVPKDPTKLESSISNTLYESHTTPPNEESTVIDGTTFKMDGMQGVNIEPTTSVESDMATATKTITIKTDTNVPEVHPTGTPMSIIIDNQSVDNSSTVVTTGLNDDIKPPVVATPSEPLKETNDKNDNIIVDNQQTNDINDTNDSKKDEPNETSEPSTDNNENSFVQTDSVESMTNTTTTNDAINTTIDNINDNNQTIDSPVNSTSDINGDTISSEPEIKSEIVNAINTSSGNVVTIDEQSDDETSNINNLNYTQIEDQNNIPVSSNGDNNNKTNEKTDDNEQVLNNTIDDDNEQVLNNTIDDDNEQVLNNTIDNVNNQTVSDKVTVVDSQSVDIPLADNTSQLNLDPLDTSSYDYNNISSDVNINALDTSTFNITNNENTNSVNTSFVNNASDVNVNPLETLTINNTNNVTKDSANTSSFNIASDVNENSVDKPSIVSETVAPAVDENEVLKSSILSQSPSQPLIEVSDDSSVNSSEQTVNTDEIKDKNNNKESNNKNNIIDSSKSDNTDTLRDNINVNVDESTGKVDDVYNPIVNDINVDDNIKVIDENNNSINNTIVGNTEDTIVLKADDIIKPTDALPMSTNMMSEIISGLIPDEIELFLYDLGISVNAAIITFIIAFNWCLMRIFISVFTSSRKESELREICTKSQRKVYYFEAEKEKLQTEIDRERENARIVEEKLQIAEYKVIPLENEYEKYKSECQLLQQKIKELETEVEKNAESEVEANRLLNELVSSQKDNTSLSSTVEDLEQQIAKQTELVTKYEDNAKQQQKDNIEFKEKIEKMTEELESLKNVHKETEKDLEVALSDNEELKISKHELDSSYNELQQQYSSLKNKVDAYIEQNDSLLDDLMKLTKELETLQEERSNKELEIESLKEILANLNKQRHSFNESHGENGIDDHLDGEVNYNSLTDIYDIVEMDLKVKNLTNDRNDLKNRFDEVSQKYEQLAEKLVSIEEQNETLLTEKEIAFQDRLKAQTELEVLTKYYKEKELEMGKEIGVQHIKRQQKEEDVNTMSSQLTVFEDENVSLRNQLQSMKKEIEDTERKYRTQITQLEKQVHENWILARTAQRSLDESKAEAAVLRQTLTMSVKSPVDGFGNDSSFLDDSASSVSSLHEFGSVMPPPPPPPPPHLFNPMLPPVPLTYGEDSLDSMNYWSHNQMIPPVPPPVSQYQTVPNNYNTTQNGIPMTSNANISYPSYNSTSQSMTYVPSVQQSWDPNTTRDSNYSPSSRRSNASPHSQYSSLSYSQANNHYSSPMSANQTLNQMSSPIHNSMNESYYQSNLAMDPNMTDPNLNTNQQQNSTGNYYQTNTANINNPTTMDTNVNLVQQQSVQSTNVLSNPVPSHWVQQQQQQQSNGNITNLHYNEYNNISNNNNNNNNNNYNNNESEASKRMTANTSLHTYMINPLTKLLTNNVITKNPIIPLTQLLLTAKLMKDYSKSDSYGEPENKYMVFLGKGDINLQNHHFNLENMTEPIEDEEVTTTEVSTDLAKNKQLLKFVARNGYDVWKRLQISPPNDDYIYVNTNKHNIIKTIESQINVTKTDANSVNKFPSKIKSKKHKNAIKYDKNLVKNLKMLYKPDQQMIKTNDGYIRHEVKVPKYVKDIITSETKSSTKSLHKSSKIPQKIDIQ